MFYLLIGEPWLGFTLQTQFFHMLVCISRKGPRKQEFPKDAKKIGWLGDGGNGSFKDGKVTHNGGVGLLTENYVIK